MDDRTCLITGSGRGIGRGIAEHFGEEGANVVVNYRSSEGSALEAVDAIEDSGGEAIAIQADVTDRDEVDAMRDRVHEAFGALDVLVNNAGITKDTRFTQMTWDEWE
jgi:3-oxoacyl-[acyl-carrier protein] reductase